MSPSCFVFLQKKIIGLYLTHIKGPIFKYTAMHQVDKQSCDLVDVLTGSNVIGCLLAIRFLNFVSVVGLSSCYIIMNEISLWI